ncbi:hypothetical protein [Streptomyces sp. NPDC059224]|uniref:hypothetical protein n=1 Tax=Streptomyces sp. NPDC059224 TaxID=3346775 RepID=UPI0036C904B0
MGFALVAVPAPVLLPGPAQGVALANCAAGAVGVAGPAGGWLTHRLPPPALLSAAGVGGPPVSPQWAAVVGSMVAGGVTAMTKGLWPRWPAGRRGGPEPRLTWP